MLLANLLLHRRGIGRCLEDIGIVGQQNLAAGQLGDRLDVAPDRALILTRQRCDVQGDPGLRIHGLDHRRVPALELEVSTIHADHPHLRLAMQVRALFPAGRYPSTAQVGKDARPAQGTAESGQRIGHRPQAHPECPEEDA